MLLELRLFSLLDLLLNASQRLGCPRVSLGSVAQPGVDLVGVVWFHRSALPELGACDVSETSLSTLWAETAMNTIRDCWSQRNLLEWFAGWGVCSSYSEVVSPWTPRYE